MSPSLVDRLRGAWAGRPYPLLVEHDDAGEMRICPAATLWTGGRAVAEQLRAQGFGPGHRIGYAGPAGIPFIWAMLGCLREGCVFQPLSPRWSARTLAERLRQAPPHAILDADGALTPHLPEAPLEGRAVRWLVWGRESREPQAIGEAAVAALVPATLSADTSDREPPIRAVLDDGMDTGSLCDLLAALVDGAEVHVAPFPVPAASPSERTSDQSTR